MHGTWSETFRNGLRILHLAGVKVCGNHLLDLLRNRICSHVVSPTSFVDPVASWQRQFGLCTSSSFYPIALVRSFAISPDSINSALAYRTSRTAASIAPLIKKLHSAASPRPVSSISLSSSTRTGTTPPRQFALKRFRRSLKFSALVSQKNSGEICPLTRPLISLSFMGTYFRIRHRRRVSTLSSQSSTSAIWGT